MTLDTHRHEIGNASALYTPHVRSEGSHSTRYGQHLSHILDQLNIGCDFRSDDCTFCFRFFFWFPGFLSVVLKPTRYPFSLVQQHLATPSKHACLRQDGGVIGKEPEETRADSRKWKLIRDTHYSPRIPMLHTHCMHGAIYPKVVWSGQLDCRRSNDHQREKEDSGKCTSSHLGCRPSTTRSLDFASQQHWSAVARYRC